jgi:hypothetical protein
MAAVAAVAAVAAAAVVVVVAPSQGAPRRTWWAFAGLTWSTSPACTGLPGWWCCPHTPATGMTTTATAADQSRAEEGQGTVGPAICAAGVPAAEMACGLDPGTSVLEGSNILANWATDIGNAGGRGGGNKAREAEEVPGAITSGEGGGSAVASARGRRQR